MPTSSQTGHSYVGRKAFTVILTIVVLFIATAIVKAAAYGQIVKLTIILVSCGVTAWAFLAREYWWLLLPAAVSFSGYFYFGFKIIMYEIGLLLCLLPLPLSLATSQASMQQSRKKLSPVIFILTGYLTIHLGVSSYLAVAQHMGGLGSILRVYTHGLWPLIFMIPFYYFGNTKYLKQALVLMYLAALLRVTLGAIALAFPKMLYIPGINFVLPATTSGGTDLRASTLFLVSFSMCFLSITRRRWLKLYHASVIFLSTFLVLLGAGRIGMLMFFWYILFFLLIRRSYLVLAATAVTFLLLLGSINARPEALYKFPKPMQRTLSALVWDSRGNAIQAKSQRSNEWHFELAREGRRRWLQNPLSFAIGSRVIAFNAAYHARSANFYSRLRIAARMGSYESGLWTVLAITGTTGLILYLWIFRYLFHGPFKSLLKNGIKDYDHAFYFLSSLNMLTWLIFCWIAGHFPGSELMIAAIAKAAYDGNKVKNDEKAIATNRELPILPDVSL